MIKTFPHLRMRAYVTDNVIAFKNIEELTHPVCPDALEAESLLMDTLSKSKAIIVYRVPEHVLWNGLSSHVYFVNPLEEVSRHQAKTILHGLTFDEKMDKLLSYD